MNKVSLGAIQRHIRNGSGPSYELDALAMVLALKDASQGLLDACKSRDRGEDDPVRWDHAGYEIPTRYAAAKKAVEDTLKFFGS